MVDHVTIHPGTDPGPLHLHASAENVYVVLQGELDVSVESNTHRLRPGDAIYIPPNHAHATHNPSSLPVRLLAIYDRSIDDDFELVAGP